MAPRPIIGTPTRQINTRTEQERERETERWRETQTETQVNDLLASEVTSKRTRGYALTFGGTEGSTLVRREWFDAVAKGMVRC